MDSQSLTVQPFRFGMTSLVVDALSKIVQYLGPVRMIGRQDLIGKSHRFLAKGLGFRKAPLSHVQARQVAQACRTCVSMRLQTRGLVQHRKIVFLRLNEVALEKSLAAGVNARVPALLGVGWKVRLVRCHGVEISFWQMAAMQGWWTW
jgi:hypothetical protein